ncbi:MAG: hypothetical protein ABMB14_37310 [Myxococcota bacterium]
MRFVVILAAAPILVTCSAAARSEAACNRIFTTICSHQFECGLTDDVLGCEADLRAEWYCDPAADLALLKACRTFARDAACEVPIPTECYDVLCDEYTGCIETADGCEEFETGLVCPEG